MFSAKLFPQHLRFQNVFSENNSLRIYIYKKMCHFIYPKKRFSSLNPCYNTWNKITTRVLFSFYFAYDVYFVILSLFFCSLSTITQGFWLYGQSVCEEFYNSMVRDFSFYFFIIFFFFFAALWRQFHFPACRQPRYNNSKYCLKLVVTTLVTYFSLSFSLR